MTTASVYAQTNTQTEGEESTKEWCENKKDELKDRVTDLMLVFFAPSTSTMTFGDFRDKGNVLVAETAEKMIDCADYLTGTEIQKLRGMHDDAAFFICMTDAALNMTSSVDTFVACLETNE
jgi:hypothetical protein